MAFFVVVLCGIVLILCITHGFWLVPAIVIGVFVACVIAALLVTYFVPVCDCLRKLWFRLAVSLARRLQPSDNQNWSLVHMTLFIGAALHVLAIFLLGIFLGFDRAAAYSACSSAFITVSYVLWRYDAPKLVLLADDLAVKASQLKHYVNSTDSSDYAGPDFDFDPVCDCESTGYCSDPSSGW